MKYYQTVRLLVSLGMAMLLISKAAFGLTGDTNVHDPALLRVGSTTYAFSTGPSIRIRKTTDSTMFSQWTYVGMVWTTQPAWIAQRLGATPPDIWAPDVEYWNGKYYLYYAASIVGQTESATMGLMTATNIEGPWTDQGEVRYTNYPIDPNIVWDGSALYMTFGSFNSGIHIRALDPATGKHSSSDTSLTLIAKGIESPSIVKDGSYYYLFGSRGLCCSGVSSTYHTVVGRATNIKGPYLDKNGVNMTQTGRTTVLSGSGDEIGPGGGEVFFVNGARYFGYHFYDASKNGQANLNIRSLSFSGGWPVLGAPVSVAPGTFRLQNRATGKMLDSYGGASNGATVRQYDGGTSNNQKWIVTVPSAGYFRLQCVAGGLFLDTMGNTANASAVGLWSSGSSYNQQWIVTQTDSGYYKLVNRGNGKAIDTGGATTNGSVMQNWTSGGSYNQQWKFVQ